MMLVTYPERRARRPDLRRASGINPGKLPGSTPARRSGQCARASARISAANFLLNFGEAMRRPAASFPFSFGRYLFFSICRASEAVRATPIAPMPTMVNDDGLAKINDLDG